MELGKKVYFLTNNSMHSRADQTVKARELGFGIQEVSMAGPIITTYIIAFTQNPNSI
jgi:ribonucleotide monophosphatase NagD (HAD superfamily)